jgi:hypothetical protein
MQNSKRTIESTIMLCMGLMLICLPAVSILHAEIPTRSARSKPKSTGRAKLYSARELIAKIIESEKKIQSVELHFDSLKGNRVAKRLDWGYEGGKEYCVGTTFAAPEPTRNIPAWNEKIKRAFNGKMLYSLEEKVNFRNGQVIKKGWVGGIQPFDWSYFKLFQPTYFLGYMLFPGRRTLGEILRDVPNVRVREKPEVIDGHPCLVIEAVGIDDRQSINDLLIWIDTERDFRPLKFEKYKSIGQENRWKVIRHRMEKIKLEKIDGLWFPVDGTGTWFYTKEILPPKGMTDQQIRSLPREKLYALSTFIQAPFKGGPSRSRIYKDTIRINKGIDPNKFSIEFPPGCEVWDDFRKAKFIVGKDGERIAETVQEQESAPEPWK